MGRGDRRGEEEITQGIRLKEAPWGFMREKEHFLKSRGSLSMKPV